MKDRRTRTADGAGHHDLVARGEEGAGPVAARREAKPRYFVESQIGGVEMAGFASAAVNWKKSGAESMAMPR